MNLIAVYDAETTGLPLFNEPSEDPRQPHLVQLAAVLVDVDTRKHVSAMNVMIKPDGWVIPDEVAAIHGITTDTATRCGISEALAVRTLLELIGASTRVGHNQGFDARIVRIAMKRYAGQFDESECEAWKNAPSQCTATMATPICALPPTERMRAAGRHHHKTPNLGEAYRHFTGLDLDGAHDAMVDVLACAEIYFAMLDRRSICA